MTIDNRLTGVLYRFGKHQELRHSPPKKGKMEKRKKTVNEKNIYSLNCKSNSFKPSNFLW